MLKAVLKQMLKAVLKQMHKAVLKQMLKAVLKIYNLMNCSPECTVHMPHV